MYQQIAHASDCGGGDELHLLGPGQRISSLICRLPATCERDDQKNDSKQEEGHQKQKLRPFTAFLPAYPFFAADGFAAGFDRPFLVTVCPAHESSFKLLYHYNIAILPELRQIYIATKKGSRIPGAFWAFKYY